MNLLYSTFDTSVRVYESENRRKITEENAVRKEKDKIGKQILKATGCNQSIKVERTAKNRG